MKFKTTALLLAACFHLAAQEVAITVDAAVSRGPVRPLVFGQNLECGDNRGIFSLPADAPEPRPLEASYAQGYWDPAGKRPAPGVAELMKEFPFGALRYPGGCLAHNYRWKESIGPIENRGSRNLAFGLDEYLRLCEALKCEPQIIVSDYAYEAEVIAQDAADLVEYLNMPAEARYPWAMKRAENGRREPYNVRYFEIGNESVHGNHANVPFRRYSGGEYVEYFNSTVAAMKRVDPEIRAGYVVADEEWNASVIPGCAASADFAIVHAYYPQVDVLAPEAAFKGAMAGNEQLLHELQTRSEAIRRCGRALPIGLTEFNIRSIAQKPDAYRYSYLAGMQCAELLCRLLQPESNVLMANYWLLLNAMYGTVVTIPGNDIPADYSGKLIEYKAASRFFRTLKSFTGDELVVCGVSGAPKLESPAVPGVLAARGEKLIEESGRYEEFPVDRYDFSRFGGLEGVAVSGTPEQRTLTVELSEAGQEAYPVFAFANRPDRIPEGEAWNARVSFEARFTPAGESAGSATLGFGIMDARGWSATRCAEAAYGVNSVREWTKFSIPLRMLPDSQRIALLLRFQHMTGKLSGKLEFRDIRLAADRAGSFPAYAGVSAFATKSADGKRLFVIAFNRSYDRPVPVRIKLAEFPVAAVRIEQLFQPEVETVADFEPLRREGKTQDGSFFSELPPHSMTAFEFF